MTPKNDALVKRKKKRFIIATIVIVVVLVGLALFYIAGAPWFLSDEVHYRRIVRRFEEKYIDTGIYADFRVYPLYDIDDNIIRYLIETEQPTNHFYVKVHWNSFFTNKSRYVMNKDTGTVWYRHRGAPATSNPLGLDINWGTCGDNPTLLYEMEGANIKYRRESPFLAAGIVGDEHRYMLQGELLPAVKRGDVFINLVTMDEMSESSLRNGKYYPGTIHSAKIFVKSYYL